MSFGEMIGYGFIQRALVAGTLIGLLCSVLGVFLVLRRFSLIGDGLAHFTFGSVALALLLRVSPDRVTLAALPLVMAAAVGILKLSEKARVQGDAAIGIVSALGIAGGVILASLAGGFNVDLFSYLFGSILAGVNTEAVNILLVLMTALTVVLAMKLVGIMLISALLILPPVAALQLARGFLPALLLSAGLGTLAVVAGLFASVALNLPTGATIIVACFCAFVAASGLRRLRR